MVVISDKIYNYIYKQDELLNKKSLANFNEISKLIYNLEKKGEVEVGWRESCGITDDTVYIKRAFEKVIKKLEQNGNLITKEIIKHKNPYATISGGFWNSIIYKCQ